MQLAPIQIQVIGNQISFLDGSVTEIMELNSYPVEIYTDENLEGSKLVVKNYGNISIEEAGTLEYKLTRLVILTDIVIPGDPEVKKTFWGNLSSSGEKITLGDKKVDEYVADLFCYEPVYELSEIPNEEKIVDYKETYCGQLKGYFVIESNEYEFKSNGLFLEGKESPISFTDEQISLTKDFSQIPKKPMVDGKLIVPNKVSITSKFPIEVQEEQENIFVNFKDLELSLESYNQEDGEYSFVNSLEALTNEELTKLKEVIKLKKANETLIDYKEVSGKIIANFQENNFGAYNISFNIVFSIESQNSETTYEDVENFVSSFSSKNSEKLDINKKEIISIGGDSFIKNEIEELDLEIEDIEAISEISDISVRYYTLNEEETLLDTKKISAVIELEGTNGKVGYIFCDTNKNKKFMVYIPEKLEFEDNGQSITIDKGVYLTTNGSGTSFVEIDLPGKFIEQIEIQENLSYAVVLQTSEVDAINFSEYDFEKVDINTGENKVNNTSQFLNLYSTTLDSKFLPSKTSKILIGIQKEGSLEDGSVGIVYITNGLEINIIPSILNLNWAETEFNYENYIWGYTLPDNYGNIQFYSSVKAQIKALETEGSGVNYVLELIPEEGSQIFGRSDCIYIDLTELEVEKQSVKIDGIANSERFYYNADKINLYRWNSQDGFYLLDKLNN